MADRIKIIDTLKKETQFNLISHMQPDGDSIGSLLAMGLGLRKIGKEATLITPGNIPTKYKFLKGSETVCHNGAVETPDRSFIVLDSSDPDRLGLYKDAVMQSKMIINIDHHVTNQLFGLLNHVDGNASATGEILFGILKDLGVEIDYNIAEALYVAISADTGSFKYENTTPYTHRVIAKLLESGINPGIISQKIFDERPYTYYILLKEALSTLELYENRTVAVMVLSKDIRERSGATTGDLEGIVNFSRNIEGIELGILFYVESDSDVKVGFRSRSLDASELAGRLNGGGHIRAAGCRMQGDFQSVKKRVMAEACKMVKELPA
ncbi:MAG: DHH family phosphoesterase [Bacillota bacterium]